MGKDKFSFWLGYSDLMTSLFFVMLMLFIISIVKMNNTIGEIGIERDRYKKLLQLEEQFDELGKFSSLQYVEEKQMFFAKDFIGIEIFNTNSDIIKPHLITKVDKVGWSLQDVVRRLHEKNPDLHFQLVIEGNAAIPWEQLKNRTFNADSKNMYKLSYERALALYLRWKAIGIDLRRYNTEIIIAGSGFNGINRDNIKEDNNKRFIIQIIPKILNFQKKLLLLSAKQQISSVTLS
jgi:hypothetical protein